MGSANTPSTTGYVIETILIRYPLWNTSETPAAPTTRGFCSAIWAWYFFFSCSCCFFFQLRVCLCVKLLLFCMCSAWPPAPPPPHCNSAGCGVFCARENFFKFFRNFFCEATLQEHPHGNQRTRSIYTYLYGTYYCKV